MALLEINDIQLKKGNAEILKGIDLSLDNGEVHAVIGPNGAGKSSLAYTLMGLNGNTPHEGSVLFEGEDITGWSITERAKKGITLAWQEPARFEGITVKQYLDISKNVDREYSSNGNKMPELSVEDALDKVALSPEKYLDRKVDKSLSGGERKRVELASILLMRPKVVVLDEPDSGIDTIAIEKIFDIIDEFKELGIGVLLITHSDKAAGVSDKASLLCSGRIVKTATPKEAADYYREYCITCPDEEYPRKEVESE